MFTDIVDSTRIKGAMQGETSARRDANFRAQIKDPHDAIVLTCVRDAGGYVVNPTGDGFCIAFEDAEEAVLCALRIQRQLENHPLATPFGVLQIRIGLHTGVASPSGDDYIASTVDKTARVQSQAGGGQVFVSHQTQVLVFERMYGVAFESRGVYDLKGLQSEPLYEAIALSNLELPPVAGSGSQEADKAFPLVLPGRRSRFRALALLGGGVLLLLVSATWSIWPPNLQPEAEIPAPLTPNVLPAGSRWEGSFNFIYADPAKHYGGSAAIQVKRRQGDKFTGVYESESDKYEWVIEGTVVENHVRWEFRRLLKKPANKPEDAIGKAYCKVDIQADQMTGLYLNRDQADEKARLDLRRSR